MKKVNLFFLLIVLTACADEPPPQAAFYVHEKFYESALFWKNEVEVSGEVIVVSPERLPDEPGLWIYPGHETVWYPYQKGKCNIREASSNDDRAFVFSVLSMLVSDDAVPLRLGTAMPPEGWPPYPYLDEEQKHKLRKHWRAMQDDCSSMFSIL